MASTDHGLRESVYVYLLECGHKNSAKALVKEAELDEKKLKDKEVKNLAEIYNAGTKALVGAK